MNGGGVVRPLPENLIKAHMVPWTLDIKITVRMTKQRINKEQIRVDLIGLDKEHQSNRVCFMSHICNQFEVSFLFLRVILMPEESNSTIGTTTHSAAAPCLNS